MRQHSRLVRGQLIAFAILTVIGLAVMSVGYVQLPAMVGLGRYRVNVELASSGGLYPTANVSYRGNDVGKVTAVLLTPNGVTAQLSIDSRVGIPADANVAVRAVSAIGEQYVDLVPPDRPSGSARGKLRDGSVIPVERTSLPRDVGALLDQVDRLLTSVADTRLRELIDSAFVAFDGAGEDLARLIDSLSLLVGQAQQHTPQIRDLLDKSGPLLDTQNQTSTEIRSWTHNLMVVTDELRRHDPALGRLLHDTPSAAQRAEATFTDLKPTLPLLLANLGSVGQVGVTYHAGLEQILLVYPQLIAALLTVVRGPLEYGAMTDFMLGLNDPPGCLTGFLPPGQWRSPAASDAPDIPGDLYCKVAQNAKEAVRGIRNTPCADVAGKRAPTPRLCHDPNGYLPEGDNPPSSDPHPVAPASSPDGGSSDPPPVVLRNYQLGDDTFVAPDGRTYRQGDVAPDGSGTVPSSWQALFVK